MAQPRRSVHRHSSASSETTAVGHHPRTQAGPVASDAEHRATRRYPVVSGRRCGVRTGERWVRRRLHPVPAGDRDDRPLQRGEGGTRDHPVDAHPEHLLARAVAEHLRPSDPRASLGRPRQVGGTAGDRDLTDRGDGNPRELGHGRDVHVDRTQRIRQFREGNLQQGRDANAEAALRNPDRCAQAVVGVGPADQRSVDSSVLARRPGGRWRCFPTGGTGRGRPSRAPASPGCRLAARIGVTDQSSTVPPSTRRTACTANLTWTSRPSADVHTDSPATGSSGFVTGRGVAVGALVPVGGPTDGWDVSRSSSPGSWSE